MYLPKQYSSRLKSTRGQIMVLFLLILVVGLAIVLSVASRTVTDIRTTTTSDESNRAYFAAEAGVEEALKQLESGNTSPLSLDFNEINQSTANTEISGSSATGTVYVYPNRLAKDEVAQIMMARDVHPAAAPDGDIDLDDLDANGGWDNNGQIRIYWGNVPAVANEAIEISIITYDPLFGFGITKAIFDISPAGGFCQFSSNTGWTKEDQVLAPPTGSGHTDDFSYRADLNLDTLPLVSGCSSRGGPVNSRVVLIRIRALYNVSPFPVALEIVSGANIPAQGFLVTSAGHTPSGVTRKLEVIKLYPAAPSLFDYVLFNGGTNPLTK